MVVGMSRAERARGRDEGGGGNMLICSFPLPSQKVSINAACAIQCFKPLIFML